MCAMHTHPLNTRVLLICKAYYYWLMQFMNIFHYYLVPNFMFSAD